MAIKCRVPRLSLLQLIHSGFLLLILGVILGVTHRYCWLDVRDPFKCGALMNQGRWLDPGRARYSKRPYQIWQPPGCLMHEYKEPELTACLQSKRLVFIGDSTTRQIFWSTAKKLDEDGANDDMRVAQKHGDLVFTRNSVGLEFIWDPFLNSSRLHGELEAYRNTPHTSGEEGREQRESAALIFVGGGLWFARHVHVNTLKVFRDSIDKIIPYMNPPAATPSTITPWPFVQDHTSRNLLLMAPVQVPQYDILSPSRSETITAEKIDAMNDYLHHLSTFQEADIVWSFSLMTWRQRVAYEQSGLHVVDNVSGRKADVLLNLRCNAEAATGVGGQEYPYDRTCCSNYRRPGWVQWAGLIGTLAILPLLVWVTRKDRRRIRLLPPGKALRSLLVFLLAVVYCFFADRTHVFEKAHKRYSTNEFVVLSSIPLFLGLLSIRRSVPTPGSREQKADQPFLSRQQTDEWKGWMQFIVLIYHYTGASKIHWIYITVRLLVASYLFMTGFGHTVYFYNNGDYSLRRVTGVLVRLNLLNCALSYMMRTDYLFYYFTPLVSFWFIVIYTTMRIGKSRNGSLPFMLSKIAISAILVTTFTRIRGPLEAVFAVIRYTCHLHWDVKEWRFRASLDIFVVYVGMLVAILSIKVYASPGGQGVDSILNHRYFHLLRLALLLFSSAAFYIFATAARRFPDKYEYNQWHPYISLLPIVAFIIVRNSHRHLRNFHSAVFAWLGRCSLETFTLQFHIWMAGDTKGLLSLGTFHKWTKGRWYDFIVVTAVFFYISWRVARAIEVLTQWIIRAEARRIGGQEGLLAEEGSEDEQWGKTELPLRKSHSSGRQTLMDIGEFTRGEAGRWKAVRTIVTCWKWLFMKLWRCEDLTTRLGVLTVAMWFLNVDMSDKGDRNGEGGHKRSKSSLALSLLHRERSRDDREDKHSTTGSSSTSATPQAPEKAASIEQSVRTFRLFESLRSGNNAAILKAIKETSSAESSTPATPLEGTTLLHLAIRCAELPVVEYILSVATSTPDVSIEINARDRDGNTPLHLAAQLGRSPIVHLLLEQKEINDSIMNYQGRTPIDLARNPDIFQQLQLARSIFLDKKVQEVHNLVGTADYAGLEKLLDDSRVQNVLDVNDGDLVTDPNTSLTAGTLLHEAARRKDTRLIQILLLHGADPFRRDRKGKLPQDVTKDERTRGVLKRSPAAAAAQRGIQEKAVLGSSASVASAILGGTFSEAALTSKEGREMKGYLKKWTNYTSGYKLRWFVLEEGVLSYYKNQGKSVDDAGSACRGAIHMRIAKLHMDPQDKQRFEILGKSSVKYHLKANHVVEAKRWYWALNNAIQWAKDEARQEEKQKIKNTEQLQQAKIDQAERTSQRDKSDSAGESASISSARQGNRNSKGLTSSINLGPIASRVVAAGSSTGPASITDEDNGTAYDSYEPSVHRVVSNIGTTTVEGDADEDEEYGDDISSREVQPASKDAFNITAQSAKLQLDLLADISSALHAERTRNPSVAISNTVIVSAMRSYESAVESLKCLVGDLLKISRDRDAYWQYRLDCEADVRRLWEDSMARVVKEQEALEGKIGESEDKRKRTKKALRDVLEGGSGVTFDSRPTSRGAEDHEQVVDALEKVMLDQSGAALQSPLTGLSRRKSRVEHIIDISDSEDEGDEEFFDAIEAGEVEVISEMPTSPPPEIIKEAESALGIRELKKAEIELSFVGYEDGPRERLKLDADNRPKISLWGILKSMIGKDMTKMTLPVSFNEPTSLLQRVAEDMEYTDLLDIAADRPDPTERMVYVAAFAASEYSSTTGRVAKPFNPLLGETYEYARPDKGYRFFIEQVSHHPPIGAAWAESPRWDYYGESAVKSKFYGKSFDINPLGTWFLRLRPITGGEELYTWKKVTSSVVGIITGTPTVDNYGPMEVKNWTTGEVCNLDFKQRGWRAAGAYEVKGRVLDSNGSQRWSIGGHWNDKIYARLTPGYDAPVTLPDNSSIKSGGSGGATQAFLVWQSHPRPSGIPFNLTPFVVTLNAIPDSLRNVVCPTDTRLRPDQRAMEDGEYDFAAVEKNRLEEKQRAKRKEREAGAEEFVPKWFTKGRCEVTGEEYWVFSGDYWKMREGVTKGGEWKGVEDIF